MEQSFTRLSPLLNYSTALYHNGEYLLIIDRSFNMESYRRIYFKDIQSIQVQKTTIWLINAAIMGVLAGIFSIAGLALWFSAESGDDGIRVLAAVMFALTLLFGAIMAKYLISGVSCKVYACTAVQRIYLPNVGTFRKLEAFKNLIIPLIEQAQGVLSENELSENLSVLWKTMRKDRQGPRRLRPKPSPTLNSGPHPEQSEGVQADVVRDSPDIATGPELGAGSEPTEQASRNVSATTEPLNDVPAALTETEPSAGKADVPRS